MSKALLLQARHDEATREEEFTSFLKFSGLDEGRFEFLNVFDTPEFSADLLDNFNALYIGGTSGTSVLEPDKHPFFDSIYALINRAVDNSVPTFASCFGFQLLVKALGGEIFHKDTDFEMGTVPISLTEASDADELFTGMPNPFMAVSVHQQFAKELPEGCTLLGYTDQCAHAFRVNEKPIWGVQFHPEISKDVLKKRLTLYKERYTENDQQLQSVFDNAVETPESNGLVLRFTKMFM